jgi:hypothetical protein
MDASMSKQGIAFVVDAKPARAVLGILSATSLWESCRHALFGSLRAVCLALSNVGKTGYGFRS